MAAPRSDSAAITQTLRALVANGYTLHSVDDGDSYDPGPGIDSDGDQIVTTNKQALDAITAVDCAHLFVTDADDRMHSVFFVMGNAPEEVICDHSVSLESVLGPLMDSWD